MFLKDLKVGKKFKLSERRGSIFTKIGHNPNKVSWVTPEGRHSGECFMPRKAVVVPIVKKN